MPAWLGRRRSLGADWCAQSALGSFVGEGFVGVQLQHRRQDFSRFGPEVGIGAGCDFFCGFDANMELGVLVLYGARREDARAVRLGSAANAFDEAFRPEHCSGIFPGFISRLAFGYTKCWCGVDVRLAVGYDLLYYWRVSSKPVEGSTIWPNGNGASVALPFGVAGPNLRGGSIK